jgi:hypothetical protein
MHKSIFISQIAVIIGLLLAGCVTNPQPKALDQIYSSYETNRIAHYKKEAESLDLAATAADPVKRNDVMNDLILLIDHNYGQIEQSLYGHKAWADFGGSLLATGLGTAGTLSGATGVKTTLSALVTAIDSTKTSFNKDVLQSQSIIAVIATMRKMRAEKLLEIRMAQKFGIHAYPLSMALDDLMEYYNAGTFVAALQGLTEDASAGKRAADGKLKALKSGGGVPPKITPTHPTVVVPPAETTSSSANSVPQKTPPSHPEGIIPPAQ